MRIAFILCSICFSITTFADAECGSTWYDEKKRCVDSGTKPGKLGFTFTPSYKTIKEIELIDHSLLCSDTSAKKQSIPAESLFKETLDIDAQKDGEREVFVYSVIDKGDGKDEKGNKIEETYFKSAYKLCLTGDNVVKRGLYRRTGGLNTGVLAVPFKLRDGDIYSDTAIGPYLSYKTERVEYLASLGISQISVSQVGSDKVESETGITLALGFSIEIDKQWDVAFLVGADHLSGDAGENWEYQDEAWFSLGIGFNFTR